MADEIIPLTEYERLRLENDLVMLSALQHLMLHSGPSRLLYNKLAERWKETKRILCGESQ